MFPYVAHSDGEREGLEEGMQPGPIEVRDHECYKSSRWGR